MAYNYDFVICIEATSNVAPYADQLNRLIKDYIRHFLDRMEELDYSLEQLRIKFILFRDFSCCSEPINETEFFDINSGSCLAEIENFIDGIKYEGGYGYCNALEAIALAAKSRWGVQDKNKYRHVIILFSNGKVRSLGGNQILLSKYPADMPINIGQLSAWLSGEDLPNNIYLNMGNEYVVSFVPAAEPWNTEDFGQLYRDGRFYSWEVFSNLGLGVEDIELFEPIDMIAGDDF